MFGKIKIITIPIMFVALIVSLTLLLSCWNDSFSASAEENDSSNRLLQSPFAVVIPGDISGVSSTSFPAGLLLSDNSSVAYLIDSGSNTITGRGYATELYGAKGSSYLTYTYEADLLLTFSYGYDEWDIIYNNLITASWYNSTVEYDIGAIYFSLGNYSPFYVCKLVTTSGEYAIYAIYLGYSYISDLTLPYYRAVYIPEAILSELNIYIYSGSDDSSYSSSVTADTYNYNFPPMLIVTERELSSVDGSTVYTITGEAYGTNVYPSSYAYSWSTVTLTGVYVGATFDVLVSFPVVDSTEYYGRNGIAYPFNFRMDAFPTQLVYRLSSENEANYQYYVEVLTNDGLRILLKMPSSSISMVDDYLVDGTGSGLYYDGNWIEYLYNIGEYLISGSIVETLLSYNIGGYNILTLVISAGFFLYVGWVLVKWVI